MADPGFDLRGAWTFSTGGGRKVSVWGIKELYM